MSVFDIELFEGGKHQAFSRYPSSIRVPIMLPPGLVPWPGDQPTSEPTIRVEEYPVREFRSGDRHRFVVIMDKDINQAIDNAERERAKAVEDWSDIVRQRDKARSALHAVSAMGWLDRLRFLFTRRLPGREGK